MTSQINDLYQNHNDTTDKYCQEQEETFIRISKGAFEKGWMLPEIYQDMLIDLPKPKNLDEAYDEFEKLFHTLQQNIIQSRIIKGAEMIDKESDPIKKKRYFEVYDDLLKKLNELGA